MTSRRTRRAIPAPLLATLLACGALPARDLRAQGDASRPAIPADLFATPAGPFAVGVRDLLWTDSARAEPFTRDAGDRRRLLVRIWYPAPAGASGERAPWVNAAEYGAASRYRLAANVRTNGIAGAPLAPGTERLPVLVYQPGGGTSRIAGTFAAEQLASHGYVVVAADHPGFSETETYPDGSRYAPDTLRAPPVTSVTREAVFDNWRWLEEDVFPTWTADASFVLDRIEALDRDRALPFAGRLDLGRIGMYGWSFGGATSLAMSITDARVKAAVDQDGQLFGAARVAGTTKPVMLMHHGGEDAPPSPEAAPLWKTLVDTTRYWDRTFTARSSGPVYDVTIADTQHGHFSDLTLVYPRQPGQLDPRRAHEIIVAYTLAFFDRHLRGRGSPLLDAASARYPEVTVRTKAAGTRD